MSVRRIIILLCIVPFAFALGPIANKLSVKQYKEKHSGYNYYKIKGKFCIKNREFLIISTDINLDNFIVETHYTCEEK